MNETSVIKCPYCGFQKEESMPSGSRRYFYECTNCHRVLKPWPGDCCVFCSFGSRKCPPKQNDAAHIPWSAGARP